MARNGKQQPARPRIEVRQAGVSSEEAAAIAAAIEQFLRDTAPPPAPAGTALSPWLRAGLLEGAGRGGAVGRSPWGEREPWLAS
jgi:hypothetical protein